MPRPFKIIALLNAKQLARLESFCLERNRTIDELRKWIKAAGVEVSRGAVYAWRNRFTESSPRRRSIKADAFPLAALASDEAIPQRIAGMLPLLAARPSLNHVLSTIAQAMAEEIRRRRISARSHGKASVPIDAAETLRRFRVLCNGARRIGPHTFECPLCGKAIQGLDRHFKREHTAKITAMPAEAFS